MMVISTNAILNCTYGFETLKTWTAYTVNDTTGQQLEEVSISSIASSSKSQLIVPPLYLDYGTYKLVYTMQLLNDYFPAEWPVTSSTETFVLIKASPLVGMMYGGGVTEIEAGYGQTLYLRPGLHSLDPDAPLDKTFGLVWFCRREGETFPMVDLDYDFSTNQSIPLPTDTKPAVDGGGCFGSGPGPLAFNAGELVLDTASLYKINETYEFLAIVSKDVRTAEAWISINILPGTPPLISISCKDPRLCHHPGLDGSHVNKNQRQAFVGTCTEACDDLVWTFDITDEFGASLTNIAANMQISGTELSLPVTFFDTYAPLEKFRVSVTATRSTNPTESSTSLMQIKVNKPPYGGTCSLDTDTAEALVEEVLINCFGFIDPENTIMSYNIYIQSTDGGPKTYMTNEYVIDDLVLHFPYVPPGTVKVGVEISDSWGAITDVEVEDIFTVTLPVEPDYTSFIDAFNAAKASGEGGVSLMVMIATAQASVVQFADFMDLDLSTMTPEEIFEKSVEITAQQREQLEFLNSEVNMVTPAQIAVATSMLNAIIGGTPPTGPKSKLLDLINRKIAVEIIDKISKSLVHSVQTPSDGLGLAKSALNCVNGLLNNVNSITGGDCEEATPADRNNGWNLDYDADIGDDINMEVITDPEEAIKCNAVGLTSFDSKTQVPLVVKGVKDIALSLLSKATDGESYVVESDQAGASMLIHKATGAELSGKTFPFPNTMTQVSFPDPFCPPDGDCTKSLGLAALVFNGKTNSETRSAVNLSPGTQTFDVSIIGSNDQEVDVSNLATPVELVIKRSLHADGSNTMHPPTTVDKAKVQEKVIPIMYNTFRMDKLNSAVRIEFNPVDGLTHRFVVLVSRHRQPTLPKLYEHAFELYNSDPTYMAEKKISKEPGEPYHIFINSHLRPGDYYVGVAELKTGYTLAQVDAAATLKTLANYLKAPFTQDYTIRTVVSGCYYYDEKLDAWLGQGIRTIKMTNDVQVCHAYHLTQFGSGFFIAPNTVNYDYVFANAGFTDNITIYMALIFTLTLFLLLFIWAYIQDKKDLEKLGATPLPDNDYRDRYIYEIIVKTNNKTNSGTKSNASFILSGDKDETSVRELADPHREILKTGATDVFVMATTRSLGKLNFLHVWHDNSGGGGGKEASWFPQVFEVRDCQTGEVFDFINKEWFAVEYGDGQVDRVLQVASQEDKEDYKFLFTGSARTNIQDGHIWLSVFTRPPRSRFSRKQRVGCCLTIVYLSMLVNAMWYDRTPSSPDTGGVKFGPFSLTVEQLGIGFISDIIVFVPAIIIILLFRRSRPMNLRESRVDTAQRIHNEESKHPLPLKEVERQPIVEEKKRFSLPWWCQIIAWFLVFGSVGVSIFYLWAYGIMFGDEKVMKWVTSLFISFFTSLLIIQPIKILILALIVTFICKKENDTDDADVDELDPVLLADEEYIHRVGEGDGSHLKKKKVIPLSSAALEAARIRRKNEMEMWAIMKEISGYLIYLMVLLVLSYGNRDPNAFYLQDNLRNALIKDGDIYGLDFNRVKDTDKWWFWAKSVILPELRAQNWYNGNPPYGLRGYLDDRANRIMGYATLRVVRVKPDSCRVATAMQNISGHCAAWASIYNEDDDNYCREWKKPQETVNASYCNWPEFKYRTAASLQNFPLMGKWDIYGGGGYVMNLRGREVELYQRFEELRRANWIDRHARAVILEFSVYNANANLFGVGHVTAEIKPGGGMHPMWRFDGIRLLSYFSGFGLFVLICECSAVLFTIYYTIRVILDIKKHRSQFFKVYWNWLELFTCSCSYMAIGLYVYRAMVTEEILEIFNRTYGNGYIRLQYVALIDEFYGYMIGMLLFSSTLKLMKMLRFNKRIGILTVTLRECWGDLSSFLVVFFIMFHGFTVMFYMILYRRLRTFHTIVAAYETCFSMMLGKFDFSEMYATSILAASMFFFFNLCTTFIMINIFLTIILKGFEKVKADIAKHPADYHIVNYLKRRFLGMVGITPFIQNRIEPSEYAAAEEMDPREKAQTEFPEKVDKMLDYINKTYFQGELDLESKKGMKKLYSGT